MPFLHFEAHRFCIDIVLQFSNKFYCNFVRLEAYDEVASSKNNTL